MTTSEKMTLIATNPEAVAMADRILNNPNRGLSFTEVLDLVCSEFFPAAPTKEQHKRYIYTEKGARAASSHNAKAGDPYNRPVSKSTIKKYIKAGFITEAQ